MTLDWLSCCLPKKRHFQEELPEHEVNEESVTFAILSDLHLETPAARPTYLEFQFSNTAKYLVLLGDIGLVKDPELREWLQGQQFHFEKIFYVLGNHEPYDIGHDQAIEQLQDSATSLDGAFVFLNQTRYDLTPNLTILGCTLYSAITPEQSGTVQMFVTDFWRIDGWTVEKHNAAHAADLEWLNNQVQHITRTEPRRKIAILTHYAPTIQPEAHNPDHLYDNSGVRSAFMTELSREACWLSPNVKLWAFGHTHHNCDFVDGQTGKRVVANQKGYKGSGSIGFDAEKVVTI